VLRTTGWRPMAAIIVLAVVTLHLLINASALAHAYLDHADPPPGSILAQAPTQLRLVFSERLEASFSQVHVLNTGRESVDRGGSHSDPDDPLALLVSLPPGLPDGVYTVAWRTVSADDGHAETGAYTLAFGVAAGAASQAQPQPSEAEFAPETAVARWWLYFAASLMFGPLLTWQIVLRPLLAVSDGPARALAVRRTARLAVVGAVALVGGHAVRRGRPGRHGQRSSGLGRLRYAAARGAHDRALRGHLVATPPAGSDCLRAAGLARCRRACGRPRAGSGAGDSAHE